MARFDVLIVGFGPVGAVIACLLGRAGLSVAVLDRERAMFDKPRAIVLDHEALRVLQFCGLDGDFFRSVTPHTGTDFRGVEGQLIKLFDPRPPPFELGWPPNVMFIQPKLEAALAEAIAVQPNVMVRRGWTVAALRQTPDGVDVEAVDETGVRQSLQAGWVVGADGANSFVREAAGLPLEDLDFGEWWVVVDAWLVGEADLPRKTTQYCQPERPATFVVGPGALRRWEIKLLPGEDPEAFRDEERIRSLLSRFVDVAALDLWRSAVYRFRAVVAERWREGRLLIAGDAAHTMPPFLAQGLCAGLRDAVNLSWKLAQVVQRGADPKLLDSYEAERRPHVAEIIRHAKDFGLIIGELDPANAARRDTALAEQLRSGAVSTERQAFVPDLRHGLIDRDALAAGALFVQPMIEMDGRPAARLDDVVGPHFLIVSEDPSALALGPRLEAQWRALGGRRLLLGDAPSPDSEVLRLREADGLIAGWLRRMGASAALVRPDRYVYGAAAAPSQLARMANDVVVALNPAASGAGGRGLPPEPQGCDSTGRRGGMPVPDGGA